MDTLKELKGEHSLYKLGYKRAIEGILKDIQESEQISVTSIENYLKDLLK